MKIQRRVNGRCRGSPRDVPVSDEKQRESAPNARWKYATGSHTAPLMPLPIKAAVLIGNVRGIVAPMMLLRPLRDC
jgi:hypothetical protein